MIRKDGFLEKLRNLKNFPNHLFTIAVNYSHADSIYQGIADHVPMVIFIFAYLFVTLSVCFYIQWDVTLVMFAALPLLIGTRLIFSKVSIKILSFVSCVYKY